MLSLLFAISFELYRTSKKIVINTFCCFLLSNYGQKVWLLRVTRLMPELSIRFFRNEQRISRKTISKINFLFKIEFYNHFLNYWIWNFCFWKIDKIYFRNVSATRPNKSFASNRRMEFPIMRFLWTYYLAIGVAKGGGGQKARPSPNWNATNDTNNNKAVCSFSFF